MAREEYTVAELETDLSPADVQRELLDIIAKLRARGVRLEGVEAEAFHISKRAHGVGIVEGVIIAVVGAVAKEAVDAAWAKILPSLKLRLKSKPKRRPGKKP